MAETVVPTLGLRLHLRKTLSVGTGRILAQALNVLLVPIILRFISPADFGAYSLLQTASLVFGVVMSLGLPTVFMARFSEFETKPSGVPRLLGVCLSQQLVAGGCFLAVGLALAKPITDSLVGPVSPKIFALLLGSEFAANHVLILARWQILTPRHEQVSFTALVRATVYLVGALAFVGGLGWGILGLAAADLLSDLAALLFCLWLARKEAHFGFSLSDLYTTLRLGLPAAPDTIFFWLIVSMPLYFLRRSGNADAGGALGLAWRMAAPIDLLGNSLVSGAARQLLESGRAVIAINVRRIFRFSVNLLALAVAALTILGPELLALFFPLSFHEASVPLPLIALGYYFLSLYYFEWVGLSGSQRTIGLSVSSGTGAISGLAVFVFAGSTINAFTAAAAFALSFLVMWLAARLLRSGARLGKAWQLLTVGCVLLALMLWLNALPLDFWLLLLVKIGALLMLANVGIAVELYQRLHERRSETGGGDRFHDIPNYAEVAKFVAGGERILDIGCSEGFFLGEVNAPLRVGLERDWERLRQGRASHQNVLFVCADAAALPFAPGAFDRIVLIGVLPYVDDAATLILNIAKRLSNNGRLIISTTTDYLFYRLINLPGWKHKIKYFRRDELAAYFVAAGLQVVSVFERGRLIAPLLSTLYTLPSFVDRRLLHAQSSLGATGRWARALTNPLIRWEYEMVGDGPGYQLFAVGEKQ